MKLSKKEQDQLVDLSLQKLKESLMSTTQEFKTYRNFEIGLTDNPYPFQWMATHKDYDGPEDNRIFTAPNEDALIMDIDMYWENEELSCLRNLVGLFDMILHRDDLPRDVKAAILQSWRWHEALDCTDSSRGTTKWDAFDEDAVEQAKTGK